MTVRPVVDVDVDVGTILPPAPIEAASLGFFLSFLVWLVATLAALAFSQLVLHPAVNMLLSDRKFDGAVDAVVGVVQGFDAIGREAVHGATRYAKSA